MTHSNPHDADRDTPPVGSQSTPNPTDRVNVDKSQRVFASPVSASRRQGPSHAAFLSRALRAGDQVDALVLDKPRHERRAGKASYVSDQQLKVMSASNAFGGLLVALVALTGDKWMSERQVTRLVGSLLDDGLVFISRGRIHRRGRGPAFLQLTDRGYRVLKSRYRTLGVDYGDITAPPEKIASGLRHAPVVSRVCGHDQHVAAITLLIRQAMRGAFGGDWHTPQWAGGRFDPPRQPEFDGPRRRYRPATLRDMPSIDGLRYVPPGDDVSLFAPLRKVYPDAGLELLLETEPGGWLIESHLLIEYQQDNSFSKIHGKLLAYEALLTGWYRMLERFEQSDSRPVVYWVCRDRDDALLAARTADRVLAGGLLRKHAMTSRPRLACPARQQFVFADETEVLAGDFVGWKLPPWPPKHPHRDPDDALTRVRLFRCEP